MKKKILSFLLVFCLVLPSVFFMTACDKDKEPTTENPPAETPVESPTETPGTGGGGGTTGGEAEPTPEPTPKPEFVYEISEDGKTVYFGEYPQTIKANDVTITSETPDDDGYYLGSDGERYYKYTINLDFEAIGMDEASCKALKLTTLSNGYEFSQGDTLYFKVEKIKWRVLTSENGEYLLMCDSILHGVAYQSNYKEDGGQYYITNEDDEFIYEQDGETKIYANNYKYSELRRFLTTDFYNQSFSESQKAMIQLTEVDNSAETTDNPSNNPYVCENTDDYVFALSYADIKNTEYGFNADPYTHDINRTTCPTDFAKATGVMTYTEEMIAYIWEVQPGDEDWDEVYAPYVGTGCAWLRSPNSFFSIRARYVDLGYSGGSDDVNDTLYGAVPALQIQIADTE